MARAALGWTWQRLAEEAGVPKASVLSFEGGETVRPTSTEAMRAALEGGGVHFLMNGPHKGGVVPPRPAPIEDRSDRNPLMPKQ